VQTFLLYSPFHFLNQVEKWSTIVFWYADFKFLIEDHFSLTDFVWLFKKNLFDIFEEYKIEN